MKEKRKKAVALKYEKEEDLAPKIIAKGVGVIAEKILEIAQEYDIPIHQDDELAEILVKLNLGDYIPPHLYKIVAEILVWVYSMNKKSRYPQTGFAP